ncbi:MAG: type II toxin-antitoxin system VapC family toxin [Chloroflexota bacterium]
MILTDTGPLVAIIDRREADHARCAALLPSLEAPMVTTWPVFIETMYMLQNISWQAQRTLWEYHQRDALILQDIGKASLDRLQTLMERYRDTPMDLADASLIVLAEQRNFTRIFTLDSHFHAYRLHGRQRLEIIP